MRLPCLSEVDGERGRGSGYKLVSPERARARRGDIYINVLQYCFRKIVELVLPLLVQCTRSLRRCEIWGNITNEEN